MGKIKVTPCDIKGLYVIEPTVFKDERGYFVETYNQNDFREAGLNMVFVQDNQSMSAKGVLRGLHFQKQYPQGKLVRAVRGTVFDVAVDLRSDSGTYGKWFGVVLSAENKSSSIFRKDLPMVSWCSRIKRSSHTNARTSIIPAMKAALSGTILKSGLTGRYQRAWN